jgi:hypothetical protein
MHLSGNGDVPRSPASPITVAAQYGNFIGGALVGPVDGKYREKPHARHGRELGPRQAGA